MGCVRGCGERWRQALTSDAPGAPTSKILSLVVLPLACIALALAITFGDGMQAGAEPKQALAVKMASSVALAGESVAAETLDPAGQIRPADRVEAAKQSVSLTVDYADGVRKVFGGLVWTANMTVFDALKLADMHPRGVDLESSGTGSTAFVKRIDDLANGGRIEGSDEKAYWQFRVNGRYGKKSAGAVVLAAGDAVVWNYGRYEAGGVASDAGAAATEGK